MSRTVMLGIGLMAVGAAIFSRGFTEKREVLKVGDVSVSAEERWPIAAWAAGFAIFAGLALVTGVARRKA